MAVLMTVMHLPWPRGRHLWILVGMGAFGYVGQAFCYFSALRHATAGLTALLLYLYPSLVTLASAALGRQRLTLIKATLAAASLFGILLAGGGNEVAGGGGHSPRGHGYSHCMFFCGHAASRRHRHGDAFNPGAGRDALPGIPAAGRDVGDSTGAGGGTGNRSGHDPQPRRSVRLTPQAGVSDYVMLGKTRFSCSWTRMNVVRLVSSLSEAEPTEILSGNVRRGRHDGIPF